jgi:lipopolysaccharide biosynthesis regulator YciM
VLGQIAVQQDAHADALKLYEQLAVKNPDYVPLVAADWLAAAEAGGGTAGLRLVIARMQRLGHAVQSPDLVKALAEAIARLDGRPAAAQWVRQILVTQPSLLGLQILLELSHHDAAPDQAGSAADLDEAALRTLVKRQAEKMSRYVCSVCGFRAQHYYWQCPGCSRWDSYSPRRTEELESSA